MAHHHPLAPPERAPIEAGIEECDDANATNGDGCSATCAVEVIDADGGIDTDGALPPTMALPES